MIASSVAALEQSFYDHDHQHRCKPKNKAQDCCQKHTEFQFPCARVLCVPKPAEQAKSRNAKNCSASKKKMPLPIVLCSPGGAGSGLEVTSIHKSRTTSRRRAHMQVRPCLWLLTNRSTHSAWPRGAVLVEQPGGEVWTPHRFLVACYTTVEMDGRRERRKDGRLEEERWPDRLAQGTSTCSTCIVST
jgi:hypothetical protein